MNNDIERVLYSEEMLGKRMDELATDLTKDYKDKRPIIISVLSGAVLFTVDMIERLDIMAQIDLLMFLVILVAQVRLEKLNLFMI